MTTGEFLYPTNCLLKVCFGGMWVGLQYLIVVFLEHTYILIRFEKKKSGVHDEIPHHGNPHDSYG